MKPKSAYGVGKIYTAIVKKVKDDRVLFDIKQLWFTADGQEEVNTRNDLPRLAATQRQYKPSRVLHCGRLHGKGTKVQSRKDRASRKQSQTAYNQLKFNSISTTSFKVLCTGQVLAARSIFFLSSSL